MTAQLLYLKHALLLKVNLCYAFEGSFLLAEKAALRPEVCSEKQLFVGGPGRSNFAVCIERNGRESFHSPIHIGNPAIHKCNDKRIW
jgi:hypothetical protein